LCSTVSSRTTTHVHKSILRQLQDEIRESKWSIYELADTVEIDRPLLWKKLGNSQAAQRCRVPLADEDIEKIVEGLRTRNQTFVICYPNHPRARRAA